MHGHPNKSYRTRRFRRRQDTAQRVAIASAPRAGPGTAEQPAQPVIHVGLPGDLERRDGGDPLGTLQYEATSQPRLHRAPLRSRADSMRLKGNTKTHSGQPRPQPLVRPDRDTVQEIPALAVGPPVTRPAPESVAPTLEWTALPADMPAGPALVAPEAAGPVEVILTPRELALRARRASAERRKVSLAALVVGALVGLGLVGLGLVLGGAL